MPHKLRKIRKKRGSRTYGYGRVGQHRGIGQRGGHGKAGRHKHKWSYVLSHEPDYFKKVRSTSPESLRKEDNTINVGELEELAQKLTREKKIRRRRISIDLKEMGYTKLLGRGKIAMPIQVKVASCSESATEKIEAAGGKVLLEDKQT
ncbi:MAG: 50S ribosomal protein L15 [Candidatus Bathyarchaeota archaeon]|nr:50S ribosomal protein L15 [Candidatus Bathyarchaeota archaeon]